MDSKKKSSKRKKLKDRCKSMNTEWTERRFLSQRSNVAYLTLAGSVAAGLAIGAGGYGQWFSEPHFSQAPYLLAAGAIALAAVILWGKMEGVAVHVGDAGVGVHEPGKPMERVAWCDMKRIEIKGGVVRIEGPKGEIRFGISTVPAAGAWVMKEATDRIPKRLKVAQAEGDALGQASADDGEMLVVEAQQITGRACRASEKVITFERDARFCPRCSEIYHKDSVPDVCLTCEGDLGEG